MKSHELRFSETNSADDSEGRTWGLDGHLFWYVIGGVFLFVVTLLFLFSALRRGFVESSAIGLVPLALTLVYVFGFRQGRPPAYDLDLVDYWTNGSGFGPPRPQSRHPMKGESDVAD